MPSSTIMNLVQGEVHIETYRLISDTEICNMKWQNVPPEVRGLVQSRIPWEPEKAQAQKGMAERKLMWGTPGWLSGCYAWVASG